MRWNLLQTLAAHPQLSESSEDLLPSLSFSSSVSQTASGFVSYLLIYSIFEELLVLQEQEAEQTLKEGEIKDEDHRFT